MEEGPKSELTVQDLPEVKITESMQAKKAEEVAPEGGEEKPATMVEAAEGEGEDVGEKQLRDQLATFIQSPQVKKSSGFSYHNSDSKSTTIPLDFEEIEGENKFIRIKMVAPDAISKVKVDELSKLIHAGWKVEGPSRIPGRQCYECRVYFLKYRRLEQRDKDALEALRVASMKGIPCFIFVDEVFERMGKAMNSLARANLLPPSAVFLPWEDTFSQDQKRAVMGLTVSAKFEDVTKSMRHITRVLIPLSKKALL